MLIGLNLHDRPSGPLDKELGQFSFPRLQNKKHITASTCINNQFKGMD